MAERKRLDFVMPFAPLPPMPSTPNSTTTQNSQIEISHFY
jgi:hypothetical protein